MEWNKVTRRWAPAVSDDEEGGKQNLEAEPSPSQIAVVQGSSSQSNAITKRRAERLIEYQFPIGRAKRSPTARSGATN
jgi:hypothetical protein